MLGDAQRRLIKVFKAYAEDMPLLAAFDLAREEVPVPARSWDQRAMDSAIKEVREDLKARGKLPQPSDPDPI